MKQTKKGNQRYFSAKAHIGADVVTGLVHSVAATAASESDVAHVHALLLGEEEIVFADAGYTEAEKRPELQHRSDLNWQIAERRGLIKALPEDNAVRLEAERSWLPRPIAASRPRLAADRGRRAGRSAPRGGLRLLPEGPDQQFATLIAVLNALNAPIDTPKSI